MKRALLLFTAITLQAGIIANAEIRIVIDHNANDAASSAFKFKNVSAPAKTNAATNAKFSIVDGERDEAGGDLEKLHDGKLPTEEDQPAENFFFNAGTEGGRLLVDLGSVVDLKQINTYSWHPNTRGPQVYKLYAADAKADGFKEQPKKGTDPEKVGWKLIVSVDTRPKNADGGGQYGVSISDSDGAIGKYRYLLFDVARTENDDPFGNTFFSEITVLTAGSASSESAEAQPPYHIRSADNYCDISIDTSRAPELKEWAEHTLAPVLAEWYPKITLMLASDGYSPPKAFSVTIAPGRGVAATGGTRVTANSNWLRKSNGDMDREAVGALLHEEVHVVQQYGRARRENPNATRAPGWLTEGIPDYIRWFIYEPQSHGADLTWMKSRGRRLALRYDGSYRITANFLNWATEKYKKNLVTLLNASIREGKYTEDLWKEYCGHTVQELGEEWKAELQKQLGIEPEPKETAPATETKKDS